MSLKSSANHRPAGFPQEGLRSLIERNPNLEGQRFPGVTDDREGPPTFDDLPLRSPAFRDILQLSGYRVALVSPSEWDYLKGAAESDAGRESFSWRELLAGVCDFVRDSNRSAEQKVARFADVCVDFIKMEVRRLSGEIVNLTKQEFKTLRCFLSHPDRVFSRDELLNEAWGYQNYPTTRTVDNHVLKLRQKLERDPARPVHFLTVHSVGYKFRPEVRDEEPEQGISRDTRVSLSESARMER